MLYQQLKIKITPIPGETKPPQNPHKNSIPGESTIPGKLILETAIPGETGEYDDNP
jgi:hypothetical protein